MLNVICLEGRLTADPELRHTQNDTAVTSFNIAVDRNFKDSSGERQTDFFTIVCWRGLAEMVVKYFHKGKIAIVNGSLETRKYTDNSGNKRTAFEVQATGVNFGGDSKKDSNSASSGSQFASSSSNSAPANVSTGDNGDFIEIDGDEELPF